MLHTLPHNPFATRHTRPGAVAPLDREGFPVDTARLLEAIGRHGGASIEGPHGTGKSTLLFALAAACEAAGQHAVIVRLRSLGDATAVLRAISRVTAGGWVCLDGWNALRPVAFIARWYAASRGVRLIVTSHTPSGFPFVVPTTASLPLLAAIVERLPEHGGLIEQADLDDALGRHPGNIREALLDLYDRFESRARLRRS